MGFGAKKWSLKTAMTTRPAMLKNWICDFTLGVADTLSDSIQCLNFAKKWFIQYCFTQDSIQNKYSIQKKIRWFNSKDNSFQ